MQPVFALNEMLQHLAASGRIGKFVVEWNNLQGEIFLANGLVVNTETPTKQGADAFLEILSWPKPFYIWEENHASSFITMDQTVQDLLLKHSLPEEVNTTISTSGAKKDSLNIGPETSINLEIQSPEIVPFSFLIRKSRILIGRDESCDLLLSDSFVSVRHAVLLTAQDGVIVQDLGSKNGTFIDGIFISKGIARIGQMIHLGQVSLKLYRD